MPVEMYSTVNNSKFVRCNNQLLYGILVTGIATKIIKLSMVKKKFYVKVGIGAREL